MKNDKINHEFLAKWFVFMPFLLLIGLIGGAFDGVLRLFQQARVDVFDR